MARGMAMAVRVLVVDDEPPLRDLMRMVLEEEGYEVMTATNGEDALERTRTFAPDVILLDMSMPVMDGRAFAEAYRHRGTPPRGLSSSARRGFWPNRSTSSVWRSASRPSSRDRT